MVAAATRTSSPRAIATLAIAASLIGAPNGVRADGDPARSELPPVQMRVVGDLCRVRADGPLACPRPASISILRGETASVQLVLEAQAPLERAELLIEVDPRLEVSARREIFLPVRSRIARPRRLR